MDMSVIHKSRENSIMNPTNSMNPTIFSSQLTLPHLIFSPNSLPSITLKKISNIVSFHLKYFSISKRTLQKYNIYITPKN